MQWCRKFVQVFCKQEKLSIWQYLSTVSKELISLRNSFVGDDLIQIQLPVLIKLVYTFCDKLFQKMKILSYHSALHHSGQTHEKVVFFFPSVFTRLRAKIHKPVPDWNRQAQERSDGEETKQRKWLPQRTNLTFILFWASWSRWLRVDIWKRWLGCQNEANTDL